MQQQILLVVTVMVVMIVLPVTIFMGYTVAEPYFEQMGGEEHDSIGGVSGNSAINFGGAIALAAASVLTPAVALGLYYFMRRRAASRGRRV